MFENYKIIATTPAGRQRYLEILLPYILKDRGIIDEYHLWVNTSNASDIKYIKSFQERFPDFIKLVWSPLTPNGSASVYPFYQYCIESNTIYIKIDDDICFIEDGAFERLLRFRVAHPEYFLVYPNIINNVICSHINQRLGNFSITTGICNYDPFCEQGWKSGIVAATIHSAFIEKLKEGSLNDYKYKQWILHQFERTSINFVAWFGEEFAKFNGQIGFVDDEQWLSVFKPKEIDKFNAICGEALVAHFAYYTQVKYLESHTNLIQSYKEIAHEFPVQEIQLFEVDWTITRDNLKLKDINYIIFPDWLQSEEVLCVELAHILRSLSNHPQKHRMTLLIDNSNIPEDEAELLLYSVIMDLMLNEDLLIHDEFQISPIGQMSEMQWELLIPEIDARIKLESENKNVINTIVATSVESIVECNIAQLV